MTKEFKQILKAIENWEKSEKGDVVFVGSFISFDQKKCDKDEDDCIKDDRIMAYGNREAIEIELEELKKILKEDKEEFINW